MQWNSGRPCRALYAQRARSLMKPTSRWDVTARRKGRRGSSSTGPRGRRGISPRQSRCLLKKTNNFPFFFFPYLVIIIKGGKKRKLKSEIPWFFSSTKKTVRLSEDAGGQQAPHTWQVRRPQRRDWGASQSPSSSSFHRGRRPLGKFLIN